MSDYLYVNDGDVEAMSVETDCGGKNPVLRCQCAKCTDWRIKMSGGKLDVVTQREKLATENRRSDVREFLENSDIDEIRDIHRHYYKPLTVGELIHEIMALPQEKIDQIWRSEGLGEAPLDADERQQS